MTPLEVPIAPPPVEAAPAPRPEALSPEKQLAQTLTSTADILGNNAGDFLQGENDLLTDPEYRIEDTDPVEAKGKKGNRIKAKAATNKKIKKAYELFRNGETAEKKGEYDAGTGMFKTEEPDPNDPSKKVELNIKSSYAGLLYGLEEYVNKHPEDAQARAVLNKFQESTIVTGADGQPSLYKDHRAQVIQTIQQRVGAEAWNALSREERRQMIIDADTTTSFGLTTHPEAYKQAKPAEQPAQQTTEQLQEMALERELKKVQEAFGAFALRAFNNNDHKWAEYALMEMNQAKMPIRAAMARTMLQQYFEEHNKPEELAQINDYLKPLGYTTKDFIGEDGKGGSLGKLRDGGVLGVSDKKAQEAFSSELSYFNVNGNLKKDAKKMFADGTLTVESVNDAHQILTTLQAEHDKLVEQGRAKKEDSPITPIAAGKETITGNIKNMTPAYVNRLNRMLHFGAKNRDELRIIHRVLLGKDEPIENKEIASTVAMAKPPEGRPHDPKDKFNAVMLDIKNREDTFENNIGEQFRWKALRKGGQLAIGAIFLAGIMAMTGMNEGVGNQRQRPAA